MEKPIWDWTNRPLSTSKLSASTPSTPKFESVSSSQTIGSITYGTFKKHIYIQIRKIYCVQAYLKHINVLKHISLLTMIRWLNGIAGNLDSNPQVTQYQIYTIYHTKVNISKFVSAKSVSFHIYIYQNYIKIYD
jgi:hypothetical protein